MNYKLITDEAKVKDFINWLPELEPHEKFYCCLFARKKYVPYLPSDKSQLKRFLATKDNLLDKIKQLECPIGTYKSGGFDIPQEALALYMMPNPRNLRAATAASIKKLTDLLYLNAKGYNPHAEVLSQIQNAKSRTFVVTFDFDNGVQLPELNPDAYKVLQTRGGTHLMVEVAKVEQRFKKTWFNSLKGYDQHGDLLSPIPGTIQGNFEPHFYESRD